MEAHPQVISEGVQRRNGKPTPFNAGDAVAAVCGLYGYPIPRSHRARLGRAAKELLEDGFAPNLVCAAMFTAVRMARPGLVSDFALEMQNASNGSTMNWTEYRRCLNDLRVAADPELSTIYQTLREAFQ